MSHAWDDIYHFSTSHHGELQALLHFLTETALREIVIVWVSDCLSAVYSVNKGRCHEDISIETLTTILYLCDINKLQLIALWIPREMNEFQDYLSHLSHYLNRVEVRGVARGVDLSVSDRSRNGKFETFQGVSQLSGALHGVVQAGRSGGFSTDVQVGSGISMSACDEQPGVNQIHCESKVGVEDVLFEQQYPVVEHNRHVQFESTGATASVQRRDRGQKKRGSSVILDSSYDRKIGHVGESGSPVRAAILGGTQRVTEKRRAARRDSGDGHLLGARLQGV